MAERASWLSRASRRHLILWALGPWLAIFLLGNLVLSAQYAFPHYSPTLEGLAIQALFTGIGAGGMVLGVMGLGSVPFALFAIVVPWAAIVATATWMLRTRRVHYLIALEILAGLQIACGLVFMVGLASV